MKKQAIMMAGFAGLALGGCIQVKAPAKTIAINLNGKGQQEVVVRLQRDAQDLIQNNPELFPHGHARCPGSPLVPPSRWHRHFQ